MPLDRGVRIHDRLAVEVAAALGVHLVLDVQAGDAGILEGLHRARDVHRLAEARVGVDEASDRSVMRAICAPRAATSVSVVRPMSGRPRSAAITAPEM